MTDLFKLGLRASAEAVREGRCTSVQLVDDCLRRIVAREPMVRAFRDLDFDGARSQAKARDSAPVHGALNGVPVAVKECYDVEGRLCTWGTPIHSNRRGQSDAVLVERLREAGAVIVGTTIATEYAIADAGPTTNPHDPDLTPGGSSSGSAAAVAAGMVPMAIGSQAVGSIVRPSVYCGVYGLKPTKGAISGRGGMPLSQFLDHPGPIARHPDDLALSCEVLFRKDPEDTYSRSITAPIYKDTPKDLTVLVVEGPLAHRIETPSRNALNQARQSFKIAGASVVEHRLPEKFSSHFACLEKILAYECALNHGNDRDSHGDLMSARMRQIVDDGRQISEADYRTALEEAKYYRDTLLKLLSGNTLILAAPADSVAPLISETGTGSNQLQGLWSLTWLPVLAVPIGKAHRLPIGVQLIASDGREDLLLSSCSLIAHHQKILPV